MKLRMSFDIESNQDIENLVDMGTAKTPPEIPDNQLKLRYSELPLFEKTIFQYMKDKTTYDREGLVRALKKAKLSPAYLPGARLMVLGWLAIKAADPTYQKP